jgi:hypothetical protein
MGGSREYAAAVLRPLVEQLLEVAAITAGMSVLDVRPPSADLIRALPPSTAVAVTDDEAAATTLRDELRAARAEARVVTAPLAALPFDTGAFDAVLSLFGLTGSHGGAVALAELARVGRRAIVVVWDGGATLENALRAALSAVTGTAPASLVRALEPPAAPGWSRQQLADVARFDSVARLVSALTEQHDLDVEAMQRAALVAHMESSLAAFTGADGTLRVPLRATALAMR